MTICISAIGKEKDSDEEFIVFATDHMVTYGNDKLSNEFEHKIKKYKELGLSKNIVAMLSGRTLLFEKLLKGTKYLNDYDGVMCKIHDNFRSIKKSEIHTQLLEPFNLTEKDLKDFLLRPMDNLFTKNILEGIFDHRLNSSILLIGFKDKKAQIYEVNESGTTSMRDIHFHTIGSGSFNASNTLFIQKHCNENSLKQTIYNVYKAKRNAEVSQGVGQDTEILICSKEKVVPLSNEDQKKLKIIYENELSFGQGRMEQEDLNSLNDLTWYRKGVVENV